MLTQSYLVEQTILSICWNRAPQCQESEWQAWYSGLLPLTCSGGLLRSCGSVVPIVNSGAGGPLFLQSLARSAKANCRSHCSLDGYSVLLILKNRIPLPKPLIQSEVLVVLFQLRSSWTQRAVRRDALRFGYCVGTVSRPCLLMHITWAKGTPGGKQGCWNAALLLTRAGLFREDY